MKIAKPPMNFFKKHFLGLSKKMKFLPPELYAKVFYEYYYEKKLDLKNPTEFNEKLQWLKVYYRPDILTKLVDKYEVRKFVKEKIGEKYLNELLNVYDNVFQVNFDTLPNQFVLKTTHGYNNNIIVRDKTKLDRTKSKLKLSKWMLINQYYRGGQEWAYKNVKHRIIAEKYLAEIDVQGVSDYKFYCFNGEPKFIEVVIMVEDVPHRGYYDINWNLTPFNRGKIPEYSAEIKAPETLPEMLHISRKLSKDFPFVRVDLYSLSVGIKFGELTFYPADARFPFYPEKYNKVIGDMMKLPKVPKGQKAIKEV